MSATPPVADRLTFAWRPSADPAYAWDVTATEHRPRADKVTRYAVEVVDRASREGVVYLFAKHPDYAGDRSVEIYETWVGPGGAGWCSCAGTVCRRGGVVCRHRLAVEAFHNQQQGELL